MIKLYMTPTCPYSLKVVDLLKEKGLQFEKVDVSQNTTKAKESIKISGQMGVPVLDVDGKIVVGWNPKAIEAILSQK